MPKGAVKTYPSSTINDPCSDMFCDKADDKLYNASDDIYLLLNGLVVNKQQLLLVQVIPANSQPVVYSDTTTIRE